MQMHAPFQDYNMNEDSTAISPGQKIQMNFQSAE